MGYALEKTKNKFAELAESYCAHLARAGVYKKPFDHAHTPLFMKASAQAQKQAIEFLEIQVRIFDEMAQAGEHLKDNHRLLWRTLGRMQMTPETDIFDKLYDGCVIEIFNLDNVHVGWNMRLMELLSHTLEQVLCVPWFELCERDAESSDKMFALLQTLLNQEIKGTFAPGIGPHRIIEKNSANLGIFDFDVRFTSPLWQNRKIVGYIAIAEVEQLGCLRAQSESVFL